MSTAVAASQAGSPPASKGLNIGLWVVQILLALLFGWSGFMKVSLTLQELASQHMTWAPELPHLVRFIGVCEILGAIGIILPAATRIKPILTPIAALGILTIMILAVGFHGSRGELDHTPLNFVIGALAAFVAWGRLTRARISRR